MFSQSLSDLLHIRKEGTPDLAWPLRLKLAMDICLGVNYLHNLGIVHQDLKSSNMLVDKHYNLKVGDFGLSHFVRKTLSESAEQDDPLFTGGGGTVAYMAPELLRSGDRIGTFKSDVYSVGIILWEIASQTRPFGGRDDTVSMLYHVDENRERPLWALDMAAPEGYQRLVEDCWAASPDERPLMETVITQLRTICRAAGLD